MKHDILGKLELNEDREEYETKKTLTFDQKEVEITITLSETFGNRGVEDGQYGVIWVTNRNTVA